MALVLFDLDGTLIRTLQVIYIPTVFKTAFGVELDPYVQGTTDREWLYDGMVSLGLDPDTDPRFEKTLAELGDIYRSVRGNTPIEVIPGVEELLKELKNRGDAVGLLTGNTRDKAMAKLETTPLKSYFPFGAYGDHTRTRSELVDRAMEEAHQFTGKRFEKKQTYIIGDTIRDIRAAKEGGVKSIAIGTGTESPTVLRSENPDYLFEDFGDVNSILKAIR